MFPDVSRRGVLGAAVTVGGAGVGAAALSGPSPTFSASPPRPGTWSGARYGPRDTARNAVAPR